MGKPKWMGAGACRKCHHSCSRAVWLASRKLIPRKSTALSSAVSLGWGFLFYFTLLLSEKPPRKCNGHSNWEIATHCPCDLSEHHCCPCVAGRWRALPSAAYTQNRSPGFFLNKRSLLLSVEMGRSAMAASSPFSTRVPLPSSSW